MNIADIIRSQRRRLGVSQQSIATTVGVSRPTITAWENNDKQPKSRYLPKLAEALETTVSELVGEDGGIEQEFNLDPFTKVYKLFEDAVIYTEKPVDYTQEVKAQCLIEMYEAEIQGKSPAGAMLRYLMSTSPQR